jgi:hypothetical protein
VIRISRHAAFLLAQAAEERERRLRMSPKMQLRTAWQRLGRKGQRWTAYPAGVVRVAERLRALDDGPDDTKPSHCYCVSRRLH